MKQCQACGNVQDTGNFCAKCGGPLVDQTQTPTNVGPTPTAQQPGQFQQQGNSGQQPVQPNQPFQQPGAPNQFQQPGQSFQQQGQFQQGNPNQQQYQQTGPAQPNVHVERVKDQSKMFLNYFTTYLKQPSKIFGTGETQFTNGLIAIIAYALIIGLTLFVYVNGTFGGFLVDTGSLFFNVFGGSAVFIIAIFAIIVISLLIVTKGFGPDSTWKELVSLLGTLSIPSIILSILSLFFFIVKSYDLGNWLFVVSLLLIISAIPLYIITRLLTIRSKSLDSFYAYLVYIVIFSILFYVLINIVWNNTVGKFMYTGFW